MVAKWNLQENFDVTDNVYLRKEMTRNLSIQSVLLLIISSFCSFASCIKQNVAVNNSNNNPVSITPSMNDTGKKYLALGDSYTIGQSVGETERFPAQTVALLRQQNIKIKDPEYIAVTGWTTANLMSAINTQNPKAPYDVVTLLIGVNDQYQGVDTTTYRTRFTLLLNKAIELAGAKKTNVFVLSIPDYSVTPFVPTANKERVRKEIDIFNSINKQITLQNNVAYIDITPSTREGATNPLLIANDGLHPSGTEYKKWAEMLAPLMKQVLQ
jgi:lysophospholipase L1-like esterase